jgi:hypothetical protein
MAAEVYYTGAFNPKTIPYDYLKETFRYPDLNKYQCNDLAERYRPKR